jgi:protein involved in ribonucleotide reduction
VVLGDVPSGGGATVYKGESAGITGALSGNTYYNETFTVTGATVGDNVHTGVNDVFMDNLVGTGQEVYTIGKVTSANTVIVYFRVDSYINENTNRKVWAEIIK